MKKRNTTNNTTNVDLGSPKVDLEETKGEHARVHEVSTGEPKRGRGRPKGSFKVRPDADQRSANAEMLDELLELSPLPDVHNLTKRLSPQAWNAAREKLLIELMPDDHLLALLKERPVSYNPQWLEAYRNGRNELERTISEKKAAEDSGKTYLYGHPEPPAATAAEEGTSEGT
jgi:hypothetical protein